MNHILKNLNSRLSDTATREVLEALAGRKATRIGLSENHIPWLMACIEEAGGYAIKGYAPFESEADKGKGGWSSRAKDALPRADIIPSWQLYIAASKDVALIARELELEHREVAFGRVLGIPKCCCHFYQETRPLAETLQNDFTLFSAKATFGDDGYPIWTNTLSQYFGSSFLSFAPCSYRCEHAIRYAQSSHSFLQNIDNDFAMRMLQWHQYSGIYSERQGVNLFHATPVAKQRFEYDLTSLRSTDKGSSLYQALSVGTHVEMSPQRDTHLMADQKLLLTLADSDAVFMHFS
jgi:hypothetical protein